VLVFFFFEFTNIFYPFILHNTPPHRPTHRTPSHAASAALLSGEDKCMLITLNRANANQERAGGGVAGVG